MEDDKRKSLYDKVSAKYDLGSFEEFSAKLDQPGKIKSLYDKLSVDFDLGDYNTFESKLKKKEPSVPGSDNPNIPVVTIPGTGSESHSPDGTLSLPNRSVNTEPILTSQAPPTPVNEKKDTQVQPGSAPDKEVAKPLFPLSPEEYHSPLTYSNRYGNTVSYDPKNVLRNITEAEKKGAAYRTLQKAMEPSGNQKHLLNVADQILNTISDDNDGYKHELKAYIQNVNGDPNSAKESLKLAISLSPNNTRLYPELATTSAKAGDTETAIQSADKYIHETGGVSDGDETRADNLAAMYRLKGNEQKADFFTKNADFIREDKAKDNLAESLKTMPEYLMSTPLNPASVLFSGIGQVGAGVESIHKAITDPTMSKTDRMLTALGGGFEIMMGGGSYVFPGEGWAGGLGKKAFDMAAAGQKVSALRQAGTMAAGFVAPELAEFNLMLNAFENVAPQRLVEVVTAPISTALNISGADMENLTPAQRGAINIGNMLGMMLWSKAAHAATQGIKAETNHWLKAYDNFKNQEPITPETQATIAEAVSTATTNEINGIVQSLKMAADKKQVIADLRQYQNETPQPTYRVGDQLVSSPQDVVDAYKKMKAQGIEPDVQVANDPEGARFVSEQLYKHDLDAETLAKLQSLKQPEPEAESVPVIPEQVPQTAPTPVVPEVEKPIAPPAGEEVAGGETNIPQEGDSFNYRGHEGIIIKKYPQDETDKKSNYQLYRVKINGKERDLSLEDINRDYPQGKGIESGTPLIDKKNSQQNYWYNGVVYRNGNPKVVIDYTFNDRGKMRQDEMYVDYNEFDKRFTPAKSENAAKKAKSELKQLGANEPVKLGDLTDSEQSAKNKQIDEIISKYSFTPEPVREETGKSVTPNPTDNGKETQEGQGLLKPSAENATNPTPQAKAEGEGVKAEKYVSIIDKPLDKLTKSELAVRFELEKKEPHEIEKSVFDKLFKVSISKKDKIITVKNKINGREYYVSAPDFNFMGDIGFGDKDFVEIFEKGNVKSAKEWTYKQLIQNKINEGKVKPTSPVTPEQVKEKAQPTGAVIMPNKEVSASAAKAVEDVVKGLNKDITPMAGAMMYSEFKDKNLSDLSLDDGTEFAYIGTDKGLKTQMFKTLAENGYVYEYNDGEYSITDKGIKFIERVKTRLETRRGVKAGTDLFPEMANIPEFNKKVEKIKQTQPISDETIKRITDQDPKELRQSATDIERKAESSKEAELVKAVEEADATISDGTGIKELLPEDNPNIQSTSEFFDNYEKTVERQPVKPTGIRMDKNGRVISTNEKLYTSKISKWNKKSDDAYFEYVTGKIKAGEKLSKSQLEGYASSLHTRGNTVEAEGLLKEYGYSKNENGKWVNPKQSPTPTVTKPSEPKQPAKGDSNEPTPFTESKDLNAIYKAVKAKYGDAKGGKIYDTAIRLVNPNKNEIVEIRSNGVVVKEGEKLIFKPFTNTDAAHSKWTLGKDIEVTENAKPTPKESPTKRDQLVKEYADRVQAQTGNPTNEPYLKLGNQIADAVENKDVKTLRKWMNGVNPNINRLFTKLTGLAAKTQKEANESIRSLDPEAYDEEFNKPVVQKMTKEQATAKMKEAQANKVLDTKKRYDGVVKTARQNVEDVISNGGRVEVKEVNKLKEPTRQQVNRWNNEQQRDWERRNKEAGTKNEYRLYDSENSFYVITKAEYDYAQKLISDKAAPEPASDLSTATSIQDLQSRFSDKAGTPEYNKKMEEFRGSTATTVADKIINRLKDLKDTNRTLDNLQTMGYRGHELWNKVIDDIIDIVQSNKDTINRVAKAIDDFKKSDFYKGLTGKDKEGADNDLKNIQDDIGYPEKTTPKETESPEEITQTRHADTEILRDEAGIGKYEKQPQKMADIDAEAQRQIKEGRNVNEIISKVKGGDPINPVDHMILRDYVLGLRKKAIANPNDAETIRLYEEALDANDLANSAAGRSLRAIQEEWNPENSEIDMMIQNKRLLGVESLTEQQKAANKTEFNEISELKSKLQEKIDEAMRLRSELEAEKALKEEAKKVNVKKRLTHDEYVAERKTILSSIKDKWNKSRLSSVNSFVVPVPYANQLRAIAPDVLALTRSYLNEGVQNIKEITSKIKSDLDIKEITEKDIHDIIAGEYTERKQTKSELATKLNNLKREAKEINELDALENGRVPKTEGEKIRRNKKISDVKKRINELRKAQGLGQFSEEHKLESLKTRMRNEIERIEAELKSGAPIETKRPEPIKLDKEGMDLQDQLINARQRRKARILQEKYIARTWRQKTGKILLDVINGATRGAMATADVSMMLLQNGVIAFTHPAYWGKAAKESLRDMVNEKKYNRWMADAEADPRFHIAKEAGLSVTEPKTQELKDAEELFQSNLLDKIPVLGKPITINGKNYGGITQASSRVFSSMSNRIRLEMMYDLIDQWESQGKTIHNSPELYKSTARLLNAATGRAKFGKFETDARVVSQLLWSPRMYASQLELLTLPVNKTFWNAPKEVKRQIAIDAAKYIGVSLALLGLAKIAGAEVEDDPRSKDFGKIKIGDVRIGLPGGMTQWIVFATQMIMGQSKSTVTGKVKDFGAGYSETSRMDVIGRFFRGKLSPSLAFGYDLLDGRTYMGDDILTLNHAIQYTTPLSIRNMFETTANEGVFTGISTGILASTGLPVQAYSSTGVYPTQDFGTNGKKINALGENPSNYSKEVWGFMKKYNLDATPPLRSTLKYYDPETKKVVKYDSDKYALFVEKRGKYIKDRIKSLISNFDNYKASSIYRIKTTKYVDGNVVIKNNAAAERVFNEIILPQYVESIQRKANEVARDEMQSKRPTKKETEIMNILDDFENYVEGK